MSPRARYAHAARMNGAGYGVRGYGAALGGGQP